MEDQSQPPEAQPSAPLLDEEPESHVPGSFLSSLPQFFVFPAILVATLTAVYLVLRMLAGAEPASATELLAEVRAAGPHARWQVLHTLADGLRKQTLDLDEVPTPALAALYDASLGEAQAGASGPQATLQGTLLLILAHKRDPALTGRLLAALDAPDDELRRAALTALGIARDPAAAAAVAGYLQAGDPLDRELALGALAGMARAEAAGGAARELLAGQLLASDTVLARNAVLQLAALGDPRAGPFLVRMLERTSYAGDASLDGRLSGLTLTDESRAAAMAGVVDQFLIDACKAVARLGHLAALPQLERLRDDPSLKVKSAAIDALASMRAEES